MEKKQLADRLPTEPETLQIHFLLGNYYYDKIMTGEKKVISPSLCLLNSDLGWILSGRTKVVNDDDDDDDDDDLPLVSFNEFLMH